MNRTTMRSILPFGLATVLLAACGDKAAKPPAGAQPAPAATVAPASTPAPSSPAPGPASGPPASTPLRWPPLDGLVGKYPSDSGLFETGPIASDLKALLGDRLAAFKTDMQVQSPLQQEGGVLSVSGNKVHEGGREMAYLLIDPAQGALEVGLWTGGVLKTYASPAGAAIARPKDIRALLKNSAG